MRTAVKDWTQRYDEPFVMYFHVWELDVEQPRISAASTYNRIRHYRKLDKMEWIIRENLQKYFVSGAEFLGWKLRITNSNHRIKQRSKSKIQIQSKIRFRRYSLFTKKLHLIWRTLCEASKRI